MSERFLSASVCLLLLTSMAPTVAAVGPNDSVIWGISYDWGNYENDIEELTGIDTNAVNEDLEEAADFAGFLLESDQVVSGMTQFFIESWDDDETVEIIDANGDTQEVTKRVTELTIRHGTLGDSGFTAAWTDENESIDIWMSASAEQLFVIDAVYTEYVDDELMVYGGDLDMSGEFALESNMEFNLQVIAANEVLAPELGMEFSLSFEIPSIESEWRANEPLDYLHDLVTGPTDSDENDDGWFTCNNGEQIPSEWENDGEEDCEDGSDEDGSEDVFQKYIDMFEALNNSNLQKTMEAFGEKLEELIEDNDPSEPLANLDDMCPIMFWDTSNSRVLGMALMATDGGEDYEVLLGPEILGVKQHSYELSIQYLTGQDARDAKLDILGLIELRDLAPDSKHDVEELYDILGEDFLPDLDQTDTDEDGVIDYFDQDDDGDGMFDWEDSDPLSPPEPVEDESTGNSVPGLGIIATISLLGAAILIPRRDE